MGSFLQWIVGSEKLKNAVWNDFVKISYLFSPLLVGLTFHGLCIKFGWLSSLVRPIDRGKSFRGRRIFGENKTYRGIVAVALGTAIGFGIQSVVLHRYPAFQSVELLDYSSVWIIGLGLLIGAVTMVSELLNSFIKRQLYIAPGETTSGALSAFFYVFDQVDFLLGAWIVLAFIVGVTFLNIIYSILFLFVSHQVISLLGYMLGMRKTAR